MSVLSGLKIAGSAVSGFFGAYKIWILGGLAAVLMGGVTWYVYSAQTAKGRVKTLQAELEHVQRDFGALQLAVDLNQAALQTCLDINAENATVLLAQEKQVQEASTVIKLLQAESKHTVQDIRDDAEDLRGRDTECRTVDEYLPDWFTSGLFN